MIRNSLKNDCYNKDLDFVLKGETWKTLMGVMADEFNTISKEAKSEADIATKIDATIFELASQVFVPCGLDNIGLDKERGVILNKRRKTHGKLL